MPPQPDGGVAVIVASMGRPDHLARLVDDLLAQTVPPQRILLSVPRAEDLPPSLPDHPSLTVLLSPVGSCAQRNAALDALGDACDFILFLDDDYLPSRFLIERLVAFFSKNNNVVGVSGRLLADGAHGPGITLEVARKLVGDHDDGPPPPAVPTRDRYGLYGCNMAFRTTAVGATRFDERLPLYGWQEDIDFAAQIRAQGRLVSTFAFAGVHLGAKAGRSRGVRVGYSQVANPAYLARKGTMRPRYALRIAARNCVANAVHALKPEPWIDRRGRLRGNLIALLDLARGRITPERITRL